MIAPLHEAPQHEARTRALGRARRRVAQVLLQPRTSKSRFSVSRWRAWLCAGWITLIAISYLLLHAHWEFARY